MCLCAFLCTPCACKSSLNPEEGIGSVGTGSTGIGNWTQVLWNSSKCSLLNADIVQQLSQAHTTVTSLPRWNWPARQTISTLSCFCLDTLSQEHEKELRQNYLFYIEMACLKEAQQSGAWSHLWGPDHTLVPYPGLKEKLMCGKSQGNIRGWVPREFLVLHREALRIIRVHLREAGVLATPPQF